MEENNQIKFLFAVLELGDKEARAISFMKGLSGRAHWEKRQGTKKQALLYTMKSLDLDKMSSVSVDTLYDATYRTNISTDGLQDLSFPRVLSRGFEGTFAELLEELNGPTTTSVAERLQAVRLAIANGESEQAIAEANFPEWCRYRLAFKAYRLLQMKPRDFKTKVIVIQGPTGTGKSKHCQETYQGAYWKARDPWWDGYEAQETVIIDEYYGWLPFDTLLRLCDRYPMDVEVKGGKVPFLAQNIIITSNRIPTRWYDARKIYFPAFARRVDEWWVFGKCFRSKYSKFSDVKFIDIEDEDKLGDLDNDYNKLSIC